ncbi:zinc finger protein 574 [Paramormyrops kingsleyae]|nr:zinc finger protein 574-like [Paramormyrops kingsleyae]XP_023665801.1 zinc finger protein 574-like [Paramormyrops kingsleyae]XP_023665802.1 zinc finger protein 574-like [Paramormyrops kingsleyae]XP_023665803.1 zinc finger protein 574-like [Paramormyrops kingsleyae]XP_023665805.1 zinc finger protein 574-like [Paramormyrops kingsleyae]
MDDASVYMCFPCYQEFDSLEAVLAHQLTCNPEAAETGMSGLQDENLAKEPASCTLVNPCGPEGQDQPRDSSDPQEQNPVPKTECVLGSDVQIRYQCGDCGCLFDSLLLWQQHRKLDECQGAAVAPGQLTEGWHGVGEPGADEPGEEAQVEAAVESYTELRDGETAVSRDHSYLQVGEPGNLGPMDLEEQEEVEQVEAQTGPDVSWSVLEMKLTDAQNAQDGGETSNSNSKKRGSRRGKASAIAVANQSLLCVDCGCGFRLVPELVAHRKTHHGLEGALHRCSVCGESFLNTTLFLYHRRQHRKREHEEESQEGTGLELGQEVPELGQEGAGVGLGQGVAEQGQGVVGVELGQEVSEQGQEGAGVGLGQGVAEQGQAGVGVELGQEVSEQGQEGAGVGLGQGVAEQGQGGVGVELGQEVSEQGQEGAGEVLRQEGAEQEAGQGQVEAGQGQVEAGQGQVEAGQGQVEAGQGQEIIGEGQEWTEQEAGQEQVETEQGHEGAGQWSINAPGSADSLPERGDGCQDATLEAAEARKVSEPSATLTAKADMEHLGPDASGPATTVSPSFLCVTCGLAVSTEPELVQHRKTQHALGEVLHRCPECGEGFTNTTLFLYHRRQHRGITKGPAGAPGTGTHQNPSRGASVVLFDGVRLQKRRREDGAEEADRTSDVTGSSSQPPRAEPPSEPSPGGLATPAELYRDWSRTPLPHACPYCELTFTRRCLLRAHVFSHTGKKLFSCEVCGKAFSCPSNLMRHSRTHLGTRPHCCQVCGKSFSHSSTLKRHQAAHGQLDGSTQRPHACPDCAASFQTRSQLQRHRLQHAGNQFNCSTCGQSFKRKKHLDLHSLTHQEKEPKTCPHCSAQFLSQAVLNVHLRRCSGEDDRARGRGRGQGRGRSVGQMECDMCGHCCVTQEGLDLHRLSHTGQTPLRCPLSPCRRRFATSAALEEHVLAHCRRLAFKSPDATPRPFRCEHCGKGFAYASTFRLHMRTHTGERPYECSQCRKRFRQLPHLQDHERIHSGERPFVCWLCGKSFSVAARLTEHARTHSGEKPYTCTLCPRTFRSRSNLDKHSKVHGDAAAAKGTAGQGEGEAAVRTIVLLQTSTPVTSAQSQPQAEVSFPGTTSSVVLLHPSVSVVDGQDIQHAIEFIIE